VRPSTSRPGAKPPPPPIAPTADERSTWNGVDPGRVEAARARLLAGFAELGLAAPPDRIEALLRLAALLERWGQRINLSGHREVESIADRLILDAAALAVHLPPVSSLADLGSGAGFPGLPIAVLRPECALLLVEAREKRHHFQRAAIRELGVGNVEVVWGRAERILAWPHAAVIAQAMAEPSRALGWMLPWAAFGGWLALPGGERPPEIPAHPGLVVERVVEYAVPCSGVRRTLWLGRRVA
jgi:16S rRNA (guanine527-N7)-methyltransferase